MFTGIVEGVGTVRRGSRAASGGAAPVEIEVEVGRLAEGVGVGDSVALSGCCLTVTAVRGERLAFDAIPETIALTALGGKCPGDRVNVERALRAGARLDGHIVQGHVDATGLVRSLAREGADVRLTVECPGEVGRLLVPKGSVAVDGVSLTVVEPQPTQFSVALVPHTLAATTLGSLGPGDRVNLEVDVIGKYVHHYLEDLGVGRGGA